MTKPDLSIIIVNWKVRRLLEKCLQSLQKYSDGLQLEIFVVDNDSNDGTSEMMIMEYPDVVTIALPRNIGFAAANNLAVKQINADYVLLLNPDTEVLPNSLSAMLEYMKAHPQTGILGPKILNTDRSLQFSVRRNPGLWSQVFTLLKLQNVLADTKPINNFVNNSSAKFFNKTRSIFSRRGVMAHYLWHDFNYNQTQSVEQLMGAAMMIRHDLIEKIGLFDANFHLWFEEVDYCLRLRQAGYDIVYLAEASISHHSGASFEKRGVMKKQLIFNRSLLHYFWKHKPIWQWFIILLLMPINIILTLLYVAFLQKSTNE